MFAATTPPLSATCRVGPSSAPRRSSDRRTAARRAAPRAAAAAPADQGAPAAAAVSAAGTPLLALKEWAPTCAAIAAGEQTILLRKGGIKEPTFRPAARSFLLFPTSFHTDAELLKPAAAQRYAAEVAYDPKAQAQLSFGTLCSITGAWTTHNPSVLQLLDELHVWGPGFLEHRLQWRGKQPVTVLELRAARLAVPLVVPPQDDFFGCFSWVDLSHAAALPEAAQAAAAAAGLQAAGQPSAVAFAEAAAVAAAPALSDVAFAARQQVARRQLGQLSDLQELTGF